MTIHIYQSLKLFYFLKPLQNSILKKGNHDTEDKTMKKKNNVGHQIKVLMGTLDGRESRG